MNAYNLGLKLSEEYDVRYLKFYDSDNEYNVGKNYYSHNEKHGKNWLTKIFFIPLEIHFFIKI